MLLSTDFSPRNYNYTVQLQLSSHGLRTMYTWTGCRFFSCDVFLCFLLIFSKDTASSVTTAIWQVGSSVLLSEKRWPVLQVWIAVANSWWRQQHPVMSKPRYTTNVAPINPKAMMIMHGTCVRRLPSQLTWRSARSTAAVVIWAMEATYTSGQRHHALDMCPFSFSLLMLWRTELKNDCARH